MSEPILRVRNLKKYYKSGSMFGKKETVRAVDGVSFELNHGETLAIVGESGCGKSTAVKALIRIVEPTDGEILLEGEDFRTLSGAKLQAARRNIKMIFQDPYSSLNPRMTVRDIIAEPIDIDHAWKTRQEREEIVLNTMQEVGLDPSYADRYPHEFSGGQRQRIGIARAIIQRPKVVICDEPVSALDVSIQAKIINLLREIQRKQDISYIFISHDLGVVEHIANRILVMYLGHVVEEGRTEDIFAHPAHPYTRLLLNSIPKIGKPTDDESVLLEGDLPSPANPPHGCVFHTRCPYAEARCSQDAPGMKTIDGIHRCACFLDTSADISHADLAMNS
ncbi:MAG: dipeptide ABC transporter ATP-binding protein [Clostridia bacterium]|nr:dipeptide ABC transporter ATP-binding protein [Clostridia bacterium]